MLAKFALHRSTAPAHLKFCVTTVAPATPTPAQAGCPNNRWTVRIADVDFSGATLVVEQGGKVVLRQTL